MSILVAMKYLTISEFANLEGVSRQAIQDRITRGTLPTIRVKVWAKRIPVDDTYQGKVKV